MDIRELPVRGKSLMSSKSKKTVMKHLSLLFVLCSFVASVSAQSFVRQEVRPTVAILGDSYSTFDGYIPAGNQTYYSTSDWAKTGVVSVKQTWWWQVVKEGGFKLGVNDSYSGATVSYSGYNDEDYADRSFITRLPRLGNPDIILIFGGINDNWAETPLGEYKYEGFRRADMYTYRSAVAFLLQSAMERYPNAKLYFIISDDLKEGIVESTQTVCRHYGVEYVLLQGIEKESGHATVKGMESIARQVLAMMGNK